METEPHRSEETKPMLSLQLTGSALVRSAENSSLNVRAGRSSRPESTAPGKPQRRGSWSSKRPLVKTEATSYDDQLYTIPSVGQPRATVRHSCNRESDNASSARKALSSLQSCGQKGDQERQSVSSNKSESSCAASSDVDKPNDSTQSVDSFALSPESTTSADSYDGHVMTNEEKLRHFANVRERERIKAINDHYDEIRSLLSAHNLSGRGQRVLRKSRRKKLSKLDTLNVVIDCMKDMRQELSAKYVKLVKLKQALNVHFEDDHYYVGNRIPKVCFCQHTYTYRPPLGQYHAVGGDLMPSAASTPFQARLYPPQPPASSLNVPGFAHLYRPSGMHPMGMLPDRTLGEPPSKLKPHQSTYPEIQSAKDSLFDVEKVRKGTFAAKNSTLAATTNSNVFNHCASVLVGGSSSYHQESFQQVPPKESPSTNACTFPVLHQTSSAQVESHRRGGRLPPSSTLFQSCATQPPVSTSGVSVATALDSLPQSPSSPNRRDPTTPHTIQGTSKHPEASSSFPENAAEDSEPGM